MNQPPVRRIVIVGGGTAGWMMGAAASRFLLDGQRSVTLVESDEIGTIGVGEATIPPILGFNRMLGIDEAEFIRATNGTYKLGIEFVGWRNGTDRYFHPFGTHGRSIAGLNFHQVWMKLQGRAGVGDLGGYSPSTVAAALGRFAPPSGDPASPLAGQAHAYHFDAGLYAAFLRRRAESGGVERLEGRVVEVQRDPQTGHVMRLRLDDGRLIDGDLFVDCSGFRSLLLGGAMQVPFESWAHWLPCDRAIAVPSERAASLPPFTRSTAHRAGWQWRIPLQHRTGNGIVYASDYLGDDEAERLLLGRLEEAPIAAPRRLSFAAGRRARMWEGNVVALGLAGGFLEPLESTSIHLIQEGISKLFALFPDRRFTAVERDQYNRLMGDAYRSIRDFIILHYHATERTDSPFWSDMASMAVPDTLSEKIELFREKGRIFRYDDELFSIPSWVSVMLGQGIVPEGYDPVVDALDEDRLGSALPQMRQSIRRAVEALPAHADVFPAPAG